MTQPDDIACIYTDELDLFDLPGFTETTDTDRRQRLAGILDDWLDEANSCLDEDSDRLPIQRIGKGRLLMLMRPDPDRPESPYAGEWVVGATLYGQTCGDRHDRQPTPPESFYRPTEVHDE